jgi:hypothetical protein
LISHTIFLIVFNKNIKTMPSHQNPVGNSKAAKFVAANPLAPLADPFAGMVRQLLFVNAVVA